MNPITFALRRPVTALLLFVALAGAGIFGLYEKRVEVPALHTTQLYAKLDVVAARIKPLKEYIVKQYESYFHSHHEEVHHEEHKIIVTTAKSEDVVFTQPYVCQIHSQNHINVCAYDSGFLERISVKEGQAVKKGDPMFKIVPVLYQAKLDAEMAEAQLAQLEYNNTNKLYEQKVVSQNETLLLKAKLARAKAKANLAAAELNFTDVKAPFDGIVDTQHQQLGSLIKEGEILTTLSDNSVMWVYFNVPEAQYLDYMTSQSQQKEQKIELILANGTKFPHPGKISTIEAKFNNETGNIAFRADFPNPERLLRHGQTGTVLINRVIKDAVVIPQRATFEVLDKRYVYVVGKDDVAHQREIGIQKEMDDIYLINKGIGLDEKIVLEGIRQIRDGEKLEFEFRTPEVVIASLKNRAE